MQSFALAKSIQLRLSAVYFYCRWTLHAHAVSRRSFSNNIDRNMDFIRMNQGSFLAQQPKVNPFYFHCVSSYSDDGGSFLRWNSYTIATKQKLYNEF